MQIISYKHYGKSSLEGNFDLKIPKWGDITIYGMSYFKKNNQQWISFPARKYEKNGESKYLPYLRFESPELMKKFQEAVLSLLLEYLAKNPPQANQMSFPGIKDDSSIFNNVYTPPNF